MIKTYGPYTRPDGRKHVVIYDNVTGKKTTMSYPKYLMEQHLGRKLEDWETVDHIDEDFTNDDLSNLQILSRQANASKASKGPTMITVVCPACKIEFTLEARVYKARQLKNSSHMVFCSRSCGNSIVL